MIDPSTDDKSTDRNVLVRNPMVLLITKLISSKYDLPIIATGGVSSYENVKELLDNGASLTGMATLLVSDPFQIPLINYRLSTND